MHRQMMATMLLLTATLAGTSRAQAPATDAPPATPAPVEAPGGVRMAREGALVWSQGELDVARLKPDLVTAVSASDAVKKLAKDLGISDQAARQSLTLSMPNNAPRILLRLTLPNDTPDARKAGLACLDDLAEHAIPNAVQRWADRANRQPLVALELAVEERRKELEVATARAAQQRHEVRDAAKVLDPSPEAVRGAASRLDQEKQRITLELAGQSARQKALEERVAKLADAATARVGKDPIADELEKIVKLRADEAATSEAMYKSGTLTQAELRAAQARAAEAKARLLERRETVSKAAGTELLGDLNKELVTLTITIAENEARLRYLDERIAGLSKALELVDGLEQQQSAVARARRQLDEAETQLQSLARQVSTNPPHVVSVQWTDPDIQPAGAPDQPRGGGGGGLFGGKQDGQ
jgi:hypothetical protein